MEGIVINGAYPVYFKIYCGYLFIFLNILMKM